MAPWGMPERRMWSVALLEKWFHDKFTNLIANYSIPRHGQKPSNPQVVESCSVAADQGGPTNPADNPHDRRGGVP